jgi:hypothetical protein
MQYLKELSKIAMVTPSLQPAPINGFHLKSSVISCPGIQSFSNQSLLPICAVLSPSITLGLSWAICHPGHLSLALLTDFHYRNTAVFMFQQQIKAMSSGSPPQPLLSMPYSWWLFSSFCKLLAICFVAGVGRMKCPVLVSVPG